MLILHAAIWILANLSILAFIWLAYRFGGKPPRPEATPHEITEILVRRLHEDIERHGPEWFAERRDARRG